jgi:glycosyltransferase involved in cell wall biosynthesis/LmbE family N-acetylglucosaminyl deacetylase
MEILKVADLKSDTYDAIYLSPHLDDAAYSCSNHIREQRRLGKQLLVVSFFTAGRDHEDNGTAIVEPFLDVARRREEDRAVMEELDVHYLHMDLQEALIRHKSGCTRWLSTVAEVTRVWIKGFLCQDKALEQTLVEHIEEIIKQTGCPWLLGPAGVGFHPDHLAVHSACCQVAERVPRLLVWHYCEFPYCTYSAFLWARRCELLTKWPMKEVKEPATASDIEQRKRVLALYDSQVRPVFGSLERLEAAVDRFPDERFMEARSKEQPEVSQADGAVVRRAPFGARWPMANFAECDDKTTSSPTAILFRVLVFDLILTSLAYFWCKHGFDWDSDQYTISCMKVSFGVIYVSAFRVLLFLVKPALGSWLCTSSTLLCLVAFLFVRELQSALMTMYFCLQLFLGYVELKFTKSRFPWQRKPRTSGPMNVLMISDYWPPQTHGISSHTEGLTTAMREAGNKVHVYSTNRREVDVKTEDAYLNWAVVNHWNPDVRLSVHPSLRLIGTLLFADFDIVHFILPSLISWPVAVTAWLAGKPIYVSAHCHENLGRLYMPECVFLVLVTLYHFVSGLPLYLFATSWAAPTRSFIPTHPIMRQFPPERTPIVPSSVDDQRFHSTGRDEDRATLQKRLGLDESHCIWLLVCRLAPEKDVPELFRALALSLRAPQEDGRKPVLVIAGDGPLRASLEEQVSRESLPVHFLGFVPNKEVSGLFRASDVCATNSVHETFGLTIIESLACGTPMVMPHCAVFDELYGEALAEWMYIKGDVEDLAKAIACASHPAARERLAVRRREGQLSPNLFWSWRDAAVEQVAQYRKSIKLLEEARVRSYLKTILSVALLGSAGYSFFVGP